MTNKLDDILKETPTLAKIQVKNLILEITLEALKKANDTVEMSQSIQEQVKAL